MTKKTYHILFAEDEKPLSSILTSRFKQEHFRVSIASNGEETMKQIKKKKPDLLLLDLLMPKKDGFSVLKEIRADKDLRDLPVIVLTNLGEESGIKNTEEFGVDDYIIKANFSIDAVLERVKKVLKRKGL